MSPRTIRVVYADVMISVLAGLIAGSLHVVSGPDHLAAIAPIAAGVRRRAWVTGFRWGIGHASGVLLVGVLALLLRDLFPIEKISGWSERLVGVLLIGIGFWGIRRAFLLHAHEHVHHGEPHVHLHIHGAGVEHRKNQTHQHNHTAFGIGTLHGLAGSSHFLGVLPAMAFASTAEAITYLVAFGTGTVAAMALFSSAVASITGRFSFHTAKGYRAVMCFFSIAAVSVGVFWLIA